MMLYPAVSELEKATKSRYALVLMIAKRARKLAEEAIIREIKIREKQISEAQKSEHGNNTSAANN